MDNEDLLGDFLDFPLEGDDDLWDTADGDDALLPRFLFDELEPATRSAVPAKQPVRLATRSAGGIQPGSEALELIRGAVGEFKATKSSSTKCNILSGWPGQENEWVCSFEKDPDVKTARHGHDKKSEMIVEIDGGKFRFYRVTRRLDCKKNHGFVARIQRRKGKFQFIDCEEQDLQVKVNKKRDIDDDVVEAPRRGRARTEAGSQTGFSVVHWTRTQLNDKDWQLRVIIPGVGECSVPSSQFSPIAPDVWFHYVSDKGKTDHRAAFGIQADGDNMYLVFRGRNQEKHLLQQLQPNVFTFSRDHPRGMIKYTIDLAKKKERRDYASGEHKIVRFK